MSFQMQQHALPPLWCDTPSPSPLTRRGFIERLGLAAAVVPTMMPFNAFSASAGVDMPEATPDYAANIWNKPRYLWLKRASTGEQIYAVYWANGQVVEDGYRSLSWFMRDLRFEKMLANQHPVIERALREGRIGQQHLSPWMMMDPILLDTLYIHLAWLEYFGIRRPLVLNSGLRHVLTNAMTEGAAYDSQHTRGAAADIVVGGVPAERVSAFSRWLRVGGVGLYQSKGFTHIDRGRVRSWSS